MATSSKSKSAGVAFAQHLSAGTDKHLTGTTQVMFAGGSFTPADITAKLQSLVTLRDEVNAAKVAAQAKLAVEKTNAPALRSFMAAYVTFVKATFAGKPDVLADFGIQPKTRAPLTVEAKTAAAAKRMATRQARGTKGSKQKKDIKGTVTGIVVTPLVTPPSVPSAPSAPGSAGTTAGTSPPATSAPATTTHNASSAVTIRERGGAAGSRWPSLVPPFFDEVRRFLAANPLPTDSSPRIRPDDPAIPRAATRCANEMSALRRGAPCPCANMKVSE